MGAFEALVAGSRIILCCGSGGVGKTTTAAAVALHAARSGRRAIVVTIDPARRLADALGLGSDGLTNEPRRVALDDGVGSGAGSDGASAGEAGSEPGGELWAMMLDARATFDAVIGRYAGSPAQAEAILANRFYRNIAGVLSGTQEYMAAEKLYELHHDERFDLVVIDTPPTRNALDFLDAPGRLTRFLDHRVYRALTAPSRFGLKVLNTATQLLLKPIARIVGAEVVTDVVEFFQAFDGMEAGFRARAQTVIGLLHDDATRYVLVTSPRREAVAEAEFFAGKLADTGLAPAAVLVNRLHPLFGADPTRKRPTPPPGSRATAEWANLIELQEVAVRERAALTGLTVAARSAIFVEIPLLSGDVHDLTGLDEIAGHLFMPAPPPAH